MKIHSVLIFSKTKVGHTRYFENEYWSAAGLISNQISDPNLDGKEKWGGPFPQCGNLRIFLLIKFYVKSI